MHSSYLTQLETLGFNDWFQNQVDSDKLSQYQLARVITVHKNSYVIKNAQTDTIAEITGKLMFNAESALDYPAVGDWVYAQYFDNDAFAIIHEILPRRSALQRKMAGKRVDYQLIATNIDTAFIVQPIRAKINLRSLERYLVMIHQCNIQPIVLLSKADLLSTAALTAKQAEIKQALPDTPIITISNLNQMGLDTVRQKLSPGQTFCLVGSSGVGKTTLLNNLLVEPIFATQAVRVSDGKGKHTTTQRHLITLPQGAIIIDTPGMRELGNITIESGLEETFSDITELASQCHYRDCSHIHEAGCAVLEALEQGDLSEKRYNNYLKMNRESRHNEMSYVEKRRKSKKQGKLYRSILRGNRKYKPY